MPVIVIELFLVLGGVTAFAWWQFRDLANEKKKREARQAREAAEAPGPDGPPAPPRGPDHAA